MRKSWRGGVRVIRYHYFPVRRWETLCYPGAIVPRIREKKRRILLVPFLFASLYAHLFFLLPEYDAVHAHWLIPQGIVQSFFKKPYLVTGHGGDVTSMNRGIMGRLKVRCLRNAAHVTAVSGHLKERMQELVPGLAPDVLPMGVDTARFGRQYRVPGYFGQGNRKVVLFVGRLAEKKGVRYLIEAMGQVDAFLAVAGEGPLRRELEKQAEGLRGRAAFLGAVTHEELRAVYASADVLACPSITAADGDQEGFGLVMLEAMASGLPVVASRSGGITQLVEDGVNGLLCEEKNAEQLAEGLNRMLSDASLRSKILAGMEETVRRHDYAAAAEKYAGLLMSCMDGQACRH